MTREMAMTAMRCGCNGCVWFNRARSVVVGEVHDYGKCVVDAPRTGAKGAWPMVMSSDYCGEFVPLSGIGEGR